MQAVLFLKGGETVATTRIMPLHTGKDRTTSRAIQETIDYASNPKKTKRGELITGYACDPRTADAEFMLAKREYLERTGRYRGKDDIIAYHVRQSFLPGEITPQEANRLGYELAKRSLLPLIRTRSIFTTTSFSMLLRWIVTASSETSSAQQEQSDGSMI